MSATERRPIGQSGNDESTVLLVEDDWEMRALLAEVLRREGYGVIEVADGNGALEWLGPGFLRGKREHLPSVIVSDIWLPYCSGIEILESTRLAPRRLPVVLITGFGDVDTHRRARELGAVCVLDKPFTMDALRAAVKIALHVSGETPPKPIDGHVV
ncbi:MAG TPA: response regulator [Myxococcota bacterium]|nr:response regulator [Myxococcota bacterium]